MEMDHPPPPPLRAASADRRRCREYLLALEEERRKIQVFRRELPLCFDLVTQTIEAMRSQMDGAGSEDTASDHHGPGHELEEFMPLRPSLSLSSSEEHDSSHDAAAAAAATNGHGKEDEARTPDRKSPPTTTETNKPTTPGWLQLQSAVQLRRQEQALPWKPLALNARKAGGAFQPFEKEKRPTELPASSSPTTPRAATSAVVGDSGDKAAADAEEKHGEKETSTDAKDKGKDKEAQSRAPNRKPRRSWAPELHRRFLQALQQLGGSHVATPKQIRELMKVDGLTNDEVKSHLQKYRLHTRRPSSTAQSSIASAAPAAPPQFVVVGGIWVPPPEYAAAAAAAAAAQQQVQLTGDACGGGNTVFAPVAMLPPGPRPHSPQEQGQRQSASGCSDGRQSGDASSASPAMSSSSQTTSA